MVFQIDQRTIQLVAFVRDIAVIFIIAVVVLLNIYGNVKNYIGARMMRNPKPKSKR